MNKSKLNILWTSSDLITSEKLVLMYATNAILQSWWDEVEIIVWGGSAKLISESDMLKEKIKHAIHVGVKVSACKACSDLIGVSDDLSSAGIELKYWGEGLTEILREDGKLLTI